MLFAGSDDAVVTRVKGYIDSGTCNTITFSETDCGDTATSYYKEIIYNNKRVIISNNVRFTFASRKFFFDKSLYRMWESNSQCLSPLANALLTRPRELNYRNSKLLLYINS